MVIKGPNAQVPDSNYPYNAEKCCKLCSLQPAGPLLAKAKAVALPMPAPPPVISATFPCIYLSNVPQASSAVSEEALPADLLFAWIGAPIKRALMSQMGLPKSLAQSLAFAFELAMWSPGVRRKHARRLAKK